ncbi:MAG: hypothetical protein EKK29_08065 [Hyphomicrobiales bacterium]|nr:MAG: hypothetical protein EKK29_08065 [Hyphomicrobiales bacterium]
MDPNTRRQTFAVASYNADARTFDGKVASNDLIDRGSHFEEIDWADADVSRAAQGVMPLLDNHNGATLKAKLGNVLSLSKVQGGLLGKFELAETDEARAVAPEIASGRARALSVGYTVASWEHVGDRDGKPVLRGVKPVVFEVSVVSVPADKSCTVRGIYPRDHLEEETIRMPDPTPTPTNAPPPAPPAKPMEATRAFELLERATLLGQRSIAEREIRAGKSEDEVMNAMWAGARVHASAEGERLRSIGAPSSHLRQRGAADTYDNPEFAKGAAEDALVARLTNTKPAERALRFMNVKLTDYDDVLADMRGERRASRATANEQLSIRMMTTSDLPILTKNAGARSFRYFMQAMEGGSSAIVAPMTVANFREHTEVQASTFPALKNVGEGGELEYGYIDESGEKIAVESFGRMVMVSFQALVNDDLGGLQASIRATAIAAANLKASTIMSSLGATMSDGQGLFHATHGNLAGAGAAPGETTLSAGRVALRTQKAIGGEAILGNSPALILCGPALETTVEKLIATINPTATSDVNVFGGRLRMAIEPRISGNEWYLFADPAFYPCVKFATLAGFESPVFEEDREFNRLGMSWRVHWHIGAAPVDYRGCWKNPGA